MLKTYKLIANAMYLNGDELLFSDKYSNGLFSYNVNNKKCDLIGRFPLESKIGKYLYYTIVKYLSKLYFIPINAYAIGIYDLDTKRINEIPLPSKFVRNNSKFYCGSILNDKLYLMGYAINTILIYDLLQEVYCGVISLENYNEKIFYIHDSITIGNKIYAVSTLFNGIICIHGDNNLECIKFNDDQKGYISITQSDNKMILAPKADNDFVIYYYEEKKWIYVSNEYGKVSDSYSGGVLIDNKYVALPCFASCPIEIDLSNYKFSKCEYLVQYFENEMKQAGRYIESNEKIYISQPVVGKIIKIDKQYKNDTIEFDLLFDNMNGSYYYDLFMQEGDKLSLVDYIENLVTIE